MARDTNPLTNRPEPSRRRFLAFGAAGAGAVALAGGAAVKAATVGAPSENPELLRLGQEFGALEAVFHAADEKKRDALALFDTLAPPIPDELMLTREERGLRIGGLPKNIDGSPLIKWDNPNEPPPQIARTWLLDEQLPNYSARSKKGRLIRQKLKVAEAYEAAFEAAKESSGYPAAEQAFVLARFNLETFALTEIAETPARTLVGASIKARAFFVCANMGHEYSYRASVLLAKDLAGSILTASGHKVEAMI